MINLRRVYEFPSRDGGFRFLLERLWPRGVAESDLPLDSWLKDIAPSTTLRKRFQHDSARRGNTTPVSRAGAASGVDPTTGPAW